MIGRKLFPSLLSLALGLSSLAFFLPDKAQAIGPNISNFIGLNFLCEAKCQPISTRCFWADVAADQCSIVYGPTDENCLKLVLAWDDCLDELDACLASCGIH
ncbi:MAG: hypothetical protein KDD64_14570 [Bdellovibrionales bacterium]|nr:hypothetical protein [Bdellovibrionales bacterium]